MIGYVYKFVTNLDVAVSFPLAHQLTSTPLWQLVINIQEVDCQATYYQ